MKKHILISIVVVLLFSGCRMNSSDEPETLENVVSSTGTIITEVSLESLSPECVVEETTEPRERTQEMIDAAWDERLNYNGSGLDIIPSVRVNNNITDRWINEIYVDGVGYSELSSAVYQSQDDLFEIYDVINNEDIEVYQNVSRCDNRVLGIKTLIMDRNHNQQMTRHYVYQTWDYNGRKLLLNDIVTDYQYFISTVSPLISDALVEFDSVVVSEVISDLYNTNPEDIDYYLTGNSLNLICEIDDVYLNEEPSEYVIVQVDYRRYADLFNPEYLPGDGLMITVQNLESVNNRINTLRHDDVYDSPGGSIFLITNYYEHNYNVITYESSYVVEEGAVGNSNTGVSRYLLVLYDDDTGEEIGTATSNTIDGFASYSMDFAAILDFVAKYSSVEQE